MSGISIRFDPEADALYVSFRARSRGDVKRTAELGDGRQVDFDSNDDVLGVEFLNVSQGLNLANVPRQEEVEAALRAFPIPSPA
jgi:uncharacterized protein YuzE